MPSFRLPSQVIVACDDATGSRCYRYAVAEIQRLLGRMGISCTPLSEAGGNTTLVLRVVHPECGATVQAPSLRALLPDGYLIGVTDTGAHLFAKTPKGILNAVYDLAERLGYLFLQPGEAGEWPPASGRGRPDLPTGDIVAQPRFPHRGVFASTGGDYTIQEWMRFYAKLRLNAVSHEPDDLALAEELGLRLESGGHGLAGLIPRDLFQDKPELFRLEQPEDFYGQRRHDWNCCATHPETRQLLQSRFREKAKTWKGLHAVHLWPDDLDGGGWCFCTTCRSLSPADQAMLAMRHLADVVARDGLSLRIPVLAYHDTLFPGRRIDPSPEMFLLFAPRERCYAHAIDDPRCLRNRHYARALKDWAVKFRSIDDSHTFEYYFDQILFRGLYPFLPNVILADMKAYEAHAIQSHMSLQVGGPTVAPEFNMLVFARAHCIAALSRQILPASPGP